MSHKGISPKQAQFLKTERAKRVVPQHQEKYLADSYIASMDMQRASKAIGWLLTLPKKDAAPTQAKGKAVGEGYYVKADEVFVVVKAKTGKTYAKRLVIETQADGKKRGKYVYAPGAVFNLSEGDVLTAEAAKALSHQHGFCVACGKPLTDPKSVAQSMGPVCVKKFAGWAA